MPNASAGKTITDTAQILNGIIVNDDINSAAGIVDTKLATIATAGKVSGAALTLLANIPAGAGVLPSANLPSFLMSLLKSGSGTSTTTTNHLLDSVAITGLDVLDTLVAYITVSAITAAGGVTHLRNDTDAIILASPNATPALGESQTIKMIIRPEQQSASVVASMSITGKGTTGAEADVAGTINWRSPATLATAWTGAWTLALRNSGITATGTLRWSWSVYKIKGV